MRRLAAFGVLVGSLALLGCSPNEVHGESAPGIRAASVVGELHGESMGTTWTVKWVLEAPGDHRTEQVRAAVLGELERVDGLMSTWRADSELSVARAAQGPVPISEDTALVVAHALDLAAATGGAYDPTVEPLMEVYGFHGEVPLPPSDEALTAARAMVGWQRVRLARDAQGRATLDTGGAALDLSSIAKGHAVDRVSGALSALGIGSHLVEVGGETRVAGPGVSGALWKIGVDDPLASMAPGSHLAAVVSLTNGAVATSGNYRSIVLAGDHRYVHTMDPRTGAPAQTPVASATVVAADCRTADALATALMVLPPSDGLALIEARPGVEALLLVLDGERWVPKLSSGMAERVVLLATKGAPEHPAR